MCDMDMRLQKKAAAEVIAANAFIKIKGLMYKISDGKVYYWVNDNWLRSSLKVNEIKIEWREQSKMLADIMPGMKADNMTPEMIKALDKIIAAIVSGEWLKMPLVGSKDRPIGPPATKKPQDMGLH